MADSKPNFFAGKSVAGEREIGNRYVSDPSAVIGRFAQVEPGDLEAALDSAQAAQRMWADYHVPFGGRGDRSYGPREMKRVVAESYTTVKAAYISAGASL